MKATPKPTLGSTQLAKWRERNAFTQREAAEFIEKNGGGRLDTSYISLLENGLATPSIQRAEVIRNATGIAVESWNRPPAAPRQGKAPDTAA